MTCRTLETFYHINAHTFEKQYKEILSGYCEWDELDHADKWLLFPENIGPHLAIDESSLSNDELYTFVTNRDRHALEGSLVAVVAGTKSEAIIQVLKQIDKAERMKVVFYASNDRLNNLHLFVEGTTLMVGRFVVPAIPILQIPVCS